ncbi:MAG TPA: hypothetical protein V6C76_15690 [Drouetiella sp.]
MSQKVAYLWGPISSFSGPLAAWLVQKGWQVRVATKSALNFLSLSPLDLHSSALSLLEKSMGGREAFRTFKDRLKLVDETEGLKGTKYDAVIFCGLSPNFDESRAPRAPWAAARLPAISKALKGVPIFIVSSIWGGVQPDRVVPEEFEFERRKPLTHWESLCQNYEEKLLDGLSTLESPWYLVRIPMIAGTSSTGESLNFTGPSVLFKEIAQAAQSRVGSNLRVSYNPDSTMWFLPADDAVYTFWRYLEDELRPRICNLVSTQATLNREWMHYVAKSLKLTDIVPSEYDSLTLPKDMRKMMNDDVQIKTRNLFEVMGRYQLPPIRMNEEYFQKVLARGIEGRWGGPAVSAGKQSLGFSDRLAQYYFEEFVPAKFENDAKLKKMLTPGNSIGFLLKGEHGLGWMISADGDSAKIEKFSPSAPRPKVCLHFSGHTMMQIIQSKLPLHRAVFLHEVRVEGPLFNAMKMTKLVEQFLKDYPISSDELNSLATEQTVSSQ